MICDAIKLAMLNVISHQAIIPSICHLLSLTHYIIITNYELNGKSTFSTFVQSFRNGSAGHTRPISDGLWHDTIFKSLVCFDVGLFD